MTEQRLCTSCGEPVDGMRFCTNCGTPTAGAPTPPTSGAPEPVTGPAAQSGPMSTPARGTRVVPPGGPFGSAAPRPSYEPRPGGPQEQQVGQSAGYPNLTTRPQPYPATAPPPAPPGPGRGPGGGPPRNKVLLWTLLGILLVLVVGGGAFALGSIAVKNDGDGTVSQTPVSAPTTSDAPSSSAPSSSTSPRTGSSPKTSTAKNRAGAKVARSLSTLISDSVKAKTAVSAAVGSLDSCRHVRASIRTLDDAATSRTDLVARARRLDTSGAPAAAAVVSDLVTAWQKSAKADSAFSDYGRSLHHTDKGKCVGHEAWRNRGVRLSAQSHPAKQAAARAWNRLAHKYGLATIAWSQL